MKRTTLTLVAAAAAALFAGPALAASSASSTLGPLVVTIFDLDPNDGIEAGITFDDGSSYGYGSYVATTAGDYDYTAGWRAYDSDSAYGATNWAPVSVTSAVTGTSATATVSGDGTPGGTLISASGSTLGSTGTGLYDYGQFTATAYAPYAYYNAFTVSQNTLVLFTAGVQLDGAVTATWDPSIPDAYDWEYATANAYLYIYGAGASGNGSQQSNDSQSVGVSSQYVADPNAPWGYVYTGNSGSYSGQLAGSFVNISGGDLTGYIQAYSYASGYSYVNAIPEPETYALMLAGLGVVGLLARRRRVAQG